MFVRLIQSNLVKRDSPLGLILVLSVISSTGGGRVDPLICEDNSEPKMATNKAML